MNAAEQLASDAAERIGTAGADAIVLVRAVGQIGIVTTTGDPIAVRGLLELGAEVVRSLVLRELSEKADRPRVVVPNADGATGSAV